ncbi:hypothetical protein [Staphylococcus phage vB_SauM-V1SA19]|nr:hypothetical protein [Staphylococcus phage vB_SauM-V1SA19]
MNFYMFPYRADYIIFLNKEVHHFDLNKIYLIITQYLYHLALTLSLHLCE